MRRVLRVFMLAAVLASVVAMGIFVSAPRLAPRTQTRPAIGSPAATSSLAPTARPTLAVPTTVPTASVVPTTTDPTSPALSPTTSRDRSPSSFPIGVRPGPLVFGDEFDGPGLDSAKWAYASDRDGLGGKQHWVADSCRVTDGALRITGTVAEETPGAPPTSCAIWTQGKQAIGPYGYWEMRARIPATAGTWPAFWSVPYDRLVDPSLDGWEIDVMEAISHVVVDANLVSWNLHTRDGDGARADFEHFANPNGLGTALYAPRWHVYAMDWRADHIAWYVDGVQQFRVIEGEVIGGKTMHIPAMRQVLIVDMAVGGAEPVDVHGLPATMEVDYVRIYA